MLFSQVRRTQEGSEAYNSDSVYGVSFGAIHDHANNIRTVGMGEVAAVMNGVDFRTRHNDYSLAMPHTTDTGFQATEDIQFPNVPPRVRNKPTVAAQVAEMREWFKAWRDQDSSRRDYRRYFKPVLCYMEGMWTVTGDGVDEPFESDRHSLDAKSWYELEEKIRFLAYSGSKGMRENLAFLPRSVIGVDAAGLPVFAQWNYDILCQPLKTDVPLDRFQLVDDVSARFRTKQGAGNYARSRLARFKFVLSNERRRTAERGRQEFLDSLMTQIPGKSGPNARLTDFGIGTNQHMNVDNTSVPLNAAYYHRYYYVEGRDAMGQLYRYRGFADKNLFMAMTDQPQVAGLNLTLCDGSQCRELSQKWTYAIPLEIIYMTPLSKWNPYNLTYRGERGDTDFNTVTRGGRTGERSSPFNGVNSKRYYVTPAEFFAGPEVNTDLADTTPRGTVWVLDPQGTARAVKASGHRVFIPNIDGVGVLRQRWPIAPVHGDGSIFWKEIKALQKIVMNPIENGFLMDAPINLASLTGVNSQVVAFQTSPSNNATLNHVHTLEVTGQQKMSLMAGNQVIVTSSYNNGHRHTFKLYAENSDWDAVKYAKCDAKNSCIDGHEKMMIET